MLNNYLINRFAGLKSILCSQAASSYVFAFDYLFSGVSPLVPEVEGEVDSISSLCTQITSAFSGPPEDPFSSAPMPKPASSPQSPVAPGIADKASSQTLYSSPLLQSEAMGYFALITF